MGIFQIEAGIPAMGGVEKKSIEKIMELGLKSKISVWNRLIIKDIQSSLECGANFLHISIPSSDIQINSKLKKDRNWVIENTKKCICYAKERGARVTVGLEDASRAEPDFLNRIISEAKNEGSERVRYADTVGVLFRKRIYDEIKKIKERNAIELEIHAHNDLGMAVANSIAAAEAGAEYVNCTIGGIGERAGNCNYSQFIEAAKGCLNSFGETKMEKVYMIQKEISRIIYG
jgi:homocitrate synthase NifV